MNKCVLKKVITQTMKFLAKAVLAIVLSLGLVFGLIAVAAWIDSIMGPDFVGRLIGVIAFLFLLILLICGIVDSWGRMIQQAKRECELELTQRKYPEYQSYTWSDHCVLMKGEEDEPMG